jgi:TRAP-type mannitol/chloroaromatic compound transport system permease small subunit
LQLKRAGDGAFGIIRGEKTLNALLKVSGVIDAINLRIGKWVAWGVVAAVIVSAVNASVRKIFDVSSNSWLELQWYIFAAVFLLCASWTLIANEHVRIDVVNNLFPKRVRNWIDLLGHIFFLLPFTVVMMITGWPFFETSYLINEQSANAGGLPQWPAKFLVPLGFTLLFFQALSEIIKRIAVMKDLIPDPYAERQHPAEAEVEELIQAIESGDRKGGPQP